MREDKFQEYSEECVHFIDFSVPRMLEDFLKSRYSNKSFSIIDLGCGDGRFLFALHSKGLLKNAKRIVGVDLSEKRIERLRQLCPFAERVVADVCDLSRIQSSFDVAISLQVIEHVPDDVKMLKETLKILKTNGYLYISTVIKKPYGMWIYWNNGFKLDPTHLREYNKVEDFLDLLENIGFKMIDWKTNPVNYPLVDLLVRLLIRMNMISPSPDFYLKHKMLRKLRDKIRIKVVGYSTLEVLSQVRDKSYLRKGILLKNLNKSFPYSPSFIRSLEDREYDSQREDGYTIFVKAKKVRE